MYHHFLAFLMKRRNEAATAVALVGISIIQHPKHILERVAIGEQNPLSQVLMFDFNAACCFSFQSSMTSK